MRAVKPNPKQPRRTQRMALPPGKKWRYTAGVGVILLALAGAAGFAVQRSGNSEMLSQQAAIILRQLLQDAGFSVRSITVAGRVQTDPGELLSALNISRNDPILSIDLHAMRNRLAALPWVQEVRISRNLPDAVHVELIERRPVAIWQRNAKLVLVDRGGVEITEKDVAEYPDLPLIVGKGAPKAAGELIALLGSEPQLRNRVAAAVRVGERRWNVRLKEGIDVRLPEQDPQTAWRKLAKYEENNGLLGRDVELVDLRLANRVVVRLTQGAVRRATGPEREARIAAHDFIWGRA